MSTTTDTQLDAEPQHETPSSETPVETPEEAQPDLRAIHELPESWSDERVQAWAEGADLTQAVRTEAGVLKYDPARVNNNLADWSTEELLAHLKGELHQAPEKRTPAIIKEYRRRTTGAPLAWSDSQVLDFYRKGITPAQASNGVWITDVTRPQRKAQDWTDAELHAWAMGEIKAIGATSDQKLARELNARFALKAKDETPVSVIKTYQHHLTIGAKLVAQKTEAVAEPAPQQPAPKGELTDMNLNFIESTLQRYASAVKPGAVVSDATGGNAQRALDGLFAYVLRLEGKALVEALNLIRDFVKAHRDGLMSDSNAYRFVHLLKGDKKAQQNHINLIELFRIVTAPNGRALRKQVDIQGMLKGFNPAQQQLLVEYFRTHA